MSSVLGPSVGLEKGVRLVSSCSKSGLSRLKFVVKWLMFETLKPVHRRGEI